MTTVRLLGRLDPDLRVATVHDGVVEPDACYLAIEVHPEADLEILTLGLVKQVLARRDLPSRWRSKGTDGLTATFSAWLHTEVGR